MGAINTFLYNIINGINSFIGNYGWSIVVFTIIIKLLLLAAGSEKPKEHAPHVRSAAADLQAAEEIRQR